MRRAAIAGIDDAGAGGGARRQGRHRAVVGVAHHEQVHAHGLERAQRVERAFALLGGRGGEVEVQHVHAQADRRQLEAAAGAGRGFEKQRAQAAPGQPPAQGGAAVGIRAQGLGGVEQAGDCRGRQAFQGQQVAQAAVGMQLQVVAHGAADSGSRGRREWGSDSQRSRMTTAASASSWAAWWRLRVPAARPAANRCAASTELRRSSTCCTGSA